MENRSTEGHVFVMEIQKKILICCRKNYGSHSTVVVVVVHLAINGTGGHSKRLLC